MKEVYCVKINNKDDRQKFIEELETKGYFVKKESFFSKDEIICGIFPIIVNVKYKTIDMMGNVTTAAAAASCGMLITQEEFEKLTNNK